MIIRTLWDEKAILESKICIVCGEEKPLSEYYGKWFDGRKTSLIDGRCKKCMNRARVVSRRLRRENILSKPENCQCCGKEKELQLDHDHKTEQFRGWLCKDCNTALGKLGDNLEGVMKAVEYFKSRPSI